MNPRPRLLEMPKRTVQSRQPLQPLESSFSGNAKVLAFPMPVITQALMSQERDQTKALREARGKVDRSVIRKLERELESTRVLIRRLLEAGATREWGQRRASLLDVERDRPGAEPVKYKLLQVG